jgi:hypothetical protein
MIARTLLVIALAFSGVSSNAALLRAQFPSDAQAGTRVRLWLPEPNRQSEGPSRRQLLRGTIASVNDDTIRLAVTGAAGTIAIPRASIRRLEISGGVSRPASMVENALGGALAGSTSWALMNDPRRRGGPHYHTDWRAAGVGAVGGAVFGALTGVLFPHEHWRRVRLRR